MSQEQQLNDILEIVRFMQDNMATKRDLERFATKDELQTAKSDIITHMDGFIGLHQKLDLELVALRAKYDRLESYIEQLARHANVTLR